MPRSIMVVSTVPGTVADIQSLVLKLGCEIAGPSAFTFGAGIMRPAAGQRPLAFAIGLENFLSRAKVLATGRENGALLRGMVAGSCGARYPAWPRVCTGHGFEPSSNSDD